MENIKRWISDNLQYSRGLICKKCNKEWFEKYNFVSEWEKIHLDTKNLDSLNPTFSQRVWTILHDNPPIKCANPLCNNIPKFWSFNRGYLGTCSPTCAQHNPTTISKIKSTNIKKYGSEYGLSSDIVKEKSKKTCQKKYGVSNISMAKGINEKKIETCLKNYGTEWILNRSDLMKSGVFKKYGVYNIQHDKNTKQQTIDARRSIFYDTLTNTNRLNNKCIPLFSKNDYVLGGSDTKYLFKCNICNTNFLGWVHDGDIPRCNICYKNSSVFEKEVLEYVKTLFPTDVINNSRSILSNNKEIDIFIPSRKIAIECDGLFWHGEIGGNKNKTYHLNKTIECQNKGIQLIHIFEDEWMQKETLVKSRIKHILNYQIANSIYARNCDVRPITHDISRTFMNNNHLQGSSNGHIHYGLFNDNNLISVMTFGSLRKSLGNSSQVGVYELYRFCSSINVVGGAGKLLKHFIRTNNPSKILTYADRRWSRGNLYEKLGFTKISDGTPNYWYFGRKNNYKRFHRFGFAKHTLSKRLSTFDPNLSEWENMKNNGWDRIWDCGNLKYEMVIN